MPQVLPWIAGGLGVVNLFQGIRSMGQQERAFNLAQSLTEEQRAEIGNLMRILSDPTHPTRQVLRGQAESGIGRAVSTGGQDLLARLAGAGWTSPQTLAGPMSRLAATGVRAQGELERNLLNDFLQKRINLVGGPQVALSGGLSLAQLAGQMGTSAGEALGNLLALLTGQYGPRRISSQPPGLWQTAPGSPHRPPAYW